MVYRQGRSKRHQRESRAKRVGVPPEPRALALGWIQYQDYVRQLRWRLLPGMW